MDKACAFLRDKIYSDKVLATVRETITNALDEHLKYDIDRPVEVGLRYNVEHKVEFFVRDFAKGLSDDSIRNIFGMYFRSTKSTSNTFTGGFGLGAKAPSCYNDIFYVISHFEGTKTTYMFTLAANERGANVGQIIKMFDEPTDEEGLEVHIEVDNSDLNDFNNKINMFVRYCSRPIQFTNLYSEVVVPETPIHTTERNGFTFKLFAPGGYNNHVVGGILKMGNVEYERVSLTQIGFPSSASLKSEHPCIVVEIPVGMMSIPISRENFETTPANTRVRTQISETVAEWIKEDLNEFYDIPLMDIIAAKDDDQVKGQYFQQRKSEIYPDLWPFVSRLGRSNLEVLKVEKHKDKFLVALIPEKRTASEWRGKLVDAAKEQGKSFYQIDERAWKNYAENCQTITDLFVGKKVKSRLFFPDLGVKKDKSDFDGTKFDKPYNVQRPDHGRSRYNRNMLSLSALEIHNTARAHLGLSKAEDVEEAKEQMAEIADYDFKNRDDIGWFCVSKSSSYGYDSWKTTSKNLTEALKELGWFGPNDAIPQAIAAKIRKAEAEKQQRHQLITQATPTFIEATYRAKAEKRLSRNIKRAEQMKEFWDKIRTENSLRGRLIKNFERVGSYYYDTQRFSRSEIRKILLIK